MTEEEMIKDYIRELEEHDFQVNEHVLGNSSVRKRTFLITEGEYQMQVLRIDFDIDDRERLAAVNFLVSQLLEQMDVSSKDIIYAALHSSISDTAVVNNLTEEALEKGKSFVKFSDRLDN